MRYTSESIEKAVEMFSSMPAIGKKSAQRLTFFLLKQSDEYVEKFAASLINLKQNVKFCSNCFNYTENDPCTICSSNKRDHKTICVVEQPSDINIIEKTGEYFGAYHVLHGVLNPLEGITENDIKIKELVGRAANADEIILAINPSVEGEVTMHYIAKLIKTFDVKITRLASGVPIGSSIEFSDEATISRAFEGRTEI
jgi:recombination protein RecR